MEESKPALVPDSDSLRRELQANAADNYFSENLPSFIVLNCYRSTVVEVPALHNADRPTVMSEFNDIVSEHRLIYKRTESFKKAAYELARDELDDRMRNLIDSLENKYWSKN